MISYFWRQSGRQAGCFSSSFNTQSAAVWHSTTKIYSNKRVCYHFESCERSGRVWSHTTQGQIPISPLHMPTNNPQFPPVWLTLEHICSLSCQTLLVRAGANVSLSPWATQRLKDEWQKERNEQVQKGKEKEGEHWNSGDTQCLFVSSATDTRNTPVYSCRREGNGKSALNKNITAKKKKSSETCSALMDKFRFADPPVAP